MKRFSLLSVPLLGFGIGFPLLSHAAPYLWDGGGNGNLGGSANWDPDGAPANNGTADFTFSGGLEKSPNAQVPYSINTLLFSNITGLLPFSLTGEKITFVENSGTPPFIRNESTYSNSFDNIIEFADGGTVRAQTGNLSFNNTFITGPAGGGGYNVNFQADAGRTITLEAVGGTGNMVTLGNGTFRFNGVNISSGTLLLNGTVEVDAAIAGPSSIAVPGTLRLLSANRIASVPINVGGNLSLQGFQETIGPLSGNGNISMGTNGDLTVYQNTATTFDGNISGSGLTNSFRKEGTGVLSLGGSSNFTGTTTVAEGTLKPLKVEAIAPFSNMAVENGATLDVNLLTISVPTVTGAGTVALPGPSTLVVGGTNANFTYGGLATGTGNLNKTGTGTMQLTGSSNTPNFSGRLNVLSGIAEMQATNVFGTTNGTTVSSGATLRLMSGTLQNMAGGLRISGSGVGGIGALAISDAPADGTAIFGPVTLLASSLISNDSPDYLELKNVALGNSTLTIRGSGDVFITGSLSGAGSLIFDGGTNNVLRGDNTAHTGPIQVNSGTLQLGNSLALVSGQPVTVQANKSLIVVYDLAINTSRVLDLHGELSVHTNRSATWAGSGTVEMHLGSRLFLEPDSALTMSGTGNIIADYTFRVDTLDGSSLTLNKNVVCNDGGLQIFGIGEVFLNGTFSGSSLNSVGGTVTLGSSNRISDNAMLDLLNGAMLRLNNFSERTGGLSGDGNIDLGSGTLTLAPMNVGGLHTHSGNISGSGDVVIDATTPGKKQIFSTANTYTGRTTIQNGAILEATAAGALSSTARLTVDGAASELRLGSAGQVIGSLTGNGKIVHTSAAALLQVGAEVPAVLWSGSIEGPGVVRVAAATSSVIFTVPQPYSGPTQVTSGILISSGLLNSNITVFAGATLSGLGKHLDIDNSGLVRNNNLGSSISVDNLTLRQGSLVEMVINDWNAPPAIEAEVINRIGGNIRLAGSNLPPLAPGEIKVITIVQAEQFIGTATGMTVALAGELASSGASASVRALNGDIEVVLTAPGAADYFDWIAGFPLVGGQTDADADPDKDGVSNGIEFLVGGDPATQNDAALLPTFAVDATHLTVTYRRMTRAAHLNPIVEYSPILESWISSATGAGVTTTVQSIDATLDMVTVRIPRFGNHKLFARLKIAIPMPT